MNTYQFTVMAYNRDNDRDERIILGQADGEDKQKAFRIAMGAETLRDILSASTNIAMAEKALEEGNKELFSRLIVNRSMAQTRRGQEIVAEKGSVTDNSVSRYVKELIAQRLENVGKRYLTNLKEGKISNKEHATKVIDRKVTKLEKEIKTKKLSVKTALELLSELECV